jgi:hypothetical protein
MLGTALALPAAVPAAAGVRAGPSLPVVISGAKKGPVDISGSSVFGTIARLKLPKGAWAVVAKGFLSNDGSPAVATCRLSAGADSNLFEAKPVSGGASGSRASVLLMVVHVFPAAGAALLRCESTGGTGDVKANLIRMTAIKAGALTDRTIGGSTHTSGSGIPRIISAHTTAPVGITQSPTLGTVASVALPKGPWFVMADLWAMNTASFARVECDLSLGSDTDQTRIGLNPAGQDRDREPMGLSVVHAVAGAVTARLRCDSGNADGAVEAHDVRILAIKAGKLTNQAFGGSSATAGTGIPRIMSVHRDASDGVKGSGLLAKVASLDLPAGHWSLLATGWLQNFTGPDPTTVQCKLVAGSGVDTVHVILPLSTGSVDGFVLSTVFTSSASKTATLLCGDDQSTDQVEVQFAKITAIQAGTLTIASI